MTVGEILGRLSRYNNISIETSLGIDWLNDFQADVAYEAGPVVSYTINNVVPNTPYSLPSDFILIQKVSDGYNNVITDYDIHRNGVESTISFKREAKIITVNYVKNPDELTSIDSQLTVHPRIQQIAFLFLLFMYYDKESEGDTEESNFADKQYARYMMKRDQIFAELRTQENKPVKTTDVLPNRLSVGRINEDDNYV